ncbi:hypothetical protein JTE90_017414 [Oedothorax gibbosus]|uniref:Fibronectin type-III domain-containing protein n=1 Tax=Oedothorax gibbosus TaxID=931172 RepID=A0AAV6U741_9ARAC|nr:hypothetical protein JTE90_017414 [Oedothorax gibbosus]
MDTLILHRYCSLSDGCVFGNASFARGVRFEAGCEARCVCEGRGRVTCAPRCRRPEEEEPAPGCRLRPDPEDPDCCTLAVCAFPGVRVVSVEALSGSSVRVRVDPPSSPVRAWVRRGGGAEWVSAGGGAADEEGALEVEGLQPATDYELRVTRDNDTSNTVQVRTLPPGSSAGVCVHEGRPLAEGEEVESGCEHRCVCRAGGLLECRDRCQVWVDAVGLEGCEWRPAPDDPCCTVPVCPPHHAPNLLPFPTGGVMGGNGARCEGEGGASYRAGDIWESGDGCRTTICRCGAQGVQCTSECPPAPPRCPGPLLTTPDCPCPVCPAAEHHPPPMPPTTASPRACEFRGVPYAAGAEFRDGCAARCVCGADLRVQCAPLQCPPTPEGCLEWDEGGEDPCCPRCKHSGCVSEGVRRRPSEKWAEEGGRQCECLEGGRVRCCPRVPPRFLAPTERCPRPVVVTPDDPQMCPYVVCNNTAHGGEALEEENEHEEEQGELRAVSVVALNATAVRVRFSLPPSLVGGRGHAELRFSPDPSLAEGAWRAQRFSRPRRLFDSPHIEYVLGAGLDPSHTYYMRVRVRPDPPLPAPHDSALFKVTMPPPAAVRVDVRPLHAHPSPHGARITWRPLGHSERRLVDALLLQWRREGEGEWEETPPLHRDTSAWELRGLQPASAYELRLLLRGEEGAPALEAAPGNTLRFTTTNTTAEEPSLKASLVSVGGASASFSVSPLPRKEEVRAARVRWGGGGEEARSSYTAPPNASQPAVLEGLAPDTKYWAQLDLFLSDGRALTSDRVEFKTEKAAVSQEARSTEDGAGGVGALVAVAVVCGAAALAFALLLVVVVRRRGAAAPISRTPSEAAYDNPTYKTYDGERPENPSRALSLEK